MYLFIAALSLLLLATGVGLVAGAVELAFSIGGIGCGLLAAAIEPVHHRDKH